MATMNDDDAAVEERAGRRMLRIPIKDWDQYLDDVEHRRGTRSARRVIRAAMLEADIKSVAYKIALLQRKLGLAAPGNPTDVLELPIPMLYEFATRRLRTMRKLSHKKRTMMHRRKQRHQARTAEVGEEEEDPNDVLENFAQEPDVKVFEKLVEVEEKRRKSEERQQPQHEEGAAAGKYVIVHYSN